MSRPVDFPKTAWSPSRFATLRRCPREHDIKYRQQIAPKGEVSGARAIGSYVHDALEFVGKEALVGAELSDENYANAALYAQYRCPDPMAIVEGARLIAAYRLRYGDALAGWSGYELVAVEKVLQAHDLHTTLGGFASIADVVVRDDEGLWVVERKTGSRMSSAPASEVVKSVRTRPQFQALAYCGRDQFGDDFKGVIFDLITKTKQVGFQRLKIDRSDEELDRFAENQKALEVLATCNHQNLDACDPPFGFRCDYFKWCHGTDEDREQLFQIRLRD